MTCLLARPRHADRRVPATVSRPSHRRRWIDQVERCFALLTERRLRRGVDRSTAQPEADIRAFLDAHNASPKPVRCTGSADDILPASHRFPLRSRQIAGTMESGQ